MTLDEAWAEAEAALPAGWRVYGVNGAPDHCLAMAFGPHGEGKRCDQGVQHGGKTDSAHGTGPTPADALHALAEKLRAVS